VDGGEVSRCGANGIVFRHGARNAILNCRVRAVGEVYPSAIGINAGYWTRGRIAHNTVSDCAYCGITLGNGMKEQAAAENVVEYNTVTNVMTAIDDGRCIYLFGIEGGTVVRGNDLRGSHGRTGFAMGLYLDENVEDILCEDNRVADAARYPLHVHMGRRNVIRRNRFACGPGRVISFVRSRHCVFEDNIVTAPAPELRFANPAGAAFRGNACRTAGGAPRFAEEAEAVSYGTQPFPKGYRVEANGFARLAPLPLDERRILLFYAGRAQPRTGDPLSAVGRLAAMTLRRDGFVAATPGQRGPTVARDNATGEQRQAPAGDASGYLLTREFVMPVGGLTVNADARRGAVRVEVVDRTTTKPYPGFVRGDCLPLAGDEVAAPVRWQDADIATLAGRPVTLRFILRPGARLYAMRMGEG